MYKLLLVIAGLSWSIYGLNGTNIFEKISNTTVRKIVYFIIGLTALFYMFNLFYYFPEIDRTYLPITSLKNNSPDNSTIKVNVNVPPKSRVIYWAPEPLQIDETVSTRFIDKAYGTFKNSGITTANENGVAELSLRKPDSFVLTSFINRNIEPMINYRYSLEGGLLSEIQGTYITLNNSVNLLNKSNKKVTFVAPEDVAPDFDIPSIGAELPSASVDSDVKPDFEFKVIDGFFTDKVEPLIETENEKYLDKIYDDSKNINLTKFDKPLEAILDDRSLGTKVDHDLKHENNPLLFDNFAKF